MEECEKFLKFVRRECKRFGVQFRLRPVSYIRLNGGQVAGYFSDDTPKELVVARKRSDWLEILVHEFSHLTQSYGHNNYPFWLESMEGCTKLEEWLSGTDISDIGKWIDYVRDMELDNERRAVFLIQRWELPIDVGRYIKKANAYIHFYNRLKETRKWSTAKNSPYKNERILKDMSEEFNMDYERLAPYIRELFMEAGL